MSSRTIIYKSFHISLLDYELFWDKELRPLYQNIRMNTQKYMHMGMDWRIKNELDRRAACGGLSESGTIEMVILRDRLMMERDYQEYKKAQGR